MYIYLYIYTVCAVSDQESTEHEEADEVNDGEVAAAAEFFSWFVV